MAKRSKRFSRRLLLVLVLLLLVVPAAIAAAWMGTETMIEQTSDAEFCTTCHTMEPLAIAHTRSKHGGDNPAGLVAECTDCHLPHDNAANHLFAKATTGLRDLWAQTIYPIHKPDWIGKLEERADYVYDSGCLHCHSALERATTDDPAASAAHSAYFANADAEGASGQGPSSCVDCHKHVGHEDLRNALEAHFDEVPEMAEELVPQGEAQSEGQSAEHAADGGAEASAPAAG
ncbi:MAG: 7-cyano-7-deazaguanine reductase [Gammaproteobacteria bacterium]|nr:7-cyano-7-deazaguanine reductase [Gammaproteobacteria bacterium]